MAAILITGLAGSIQADPSQQSQQAGNQPRTQYLRYVPRPDSAAASRHFNAQWKAIFFYTPWPTYPAAVRRNKVTGSGVMRLYVNAKGRVTAVRILKSTGNQELDEEGVRTFARWRAKAGPPREVDMPLTFTIGSGKSTGPTPTPTPQRYDGLGIMKTRDR